jgi:hypothetical protein
MNDDQLAQVLVAKPVVLTATIGLRMFMLAFLINEYACSSVNALCSINMPLAR